MKKLLLIGLLILAKNIFPQTYTWARTDNAYQNSIGQALALDAAGNLFVAETYSNTGMRSGLNIVKYDISHNVVWTQKIEGKYFAYYSLATDALGNVYHAGIFADSLFINGAYVAYNGNSNMLLIKFNSAGVFQFIKQSIGPGYCSGLRVSTDALNNVYVGGSVNGTANFDGTIINSPVVYNYIVKYNQNGVLQWARNGSGNSMSGWGIGMKTDAANNTFIAGTFKGTVNFGTYSVTCFGGDPNNTENVYIAKIDAAGNWLWAKSAGGSTQEGLYDLALDNSGNPHITGFMGSSTATFGTYVLTNGGGDDYFVAKYNTNGTVAWAVNGGGAGSQMGIGICVDNQGTSYVARNSVYYSKFDNTGVYVGSDFKTASNNAMTADNNGCIYISGDITGPEAFGAFNLVPTNAQQMYVAKFCAPATNINELGYANGLAVYPNPSNGAFNIVYKNDPGGVIQVKVIDETGRYVYNKVFKDFSGELNETIDLKGLERGEYVLEITGTGIMDTQKLILQY